MFIDRHKRPASRTAAGLCLLAGLALLAACARTPDPAVSFDPAPVSAGAAQETAATGPEFAEPPADPPRRGPFAFLRRNRTPDPAPAQALPPPDAPPPPEYLTAEAPPQAQPQPESFPEPSTRPRLFGFLFKRVPGEVRAPRSATPAARAPGAETEIAMMEAPAAEAVEDSQRGGGLFGGSRRAAAAPAGPLPFGAVAEVCGLSRRDMGTEVAASHGAAKYRLYDTNPGSTAPRTQYITGFRDGCARQFTASLALFGSAAVHEATRYNPLNTNPYSATDEAYERVKNRDCRVRRGEYCPESRIARLERDAAFVSIYRDFGGSGQWMEMFLHRGELEAHEVVTQ